MFKKLLMILITMTFIINASTAYSQTFAWYTDTSKYIDSILYPSDGQPGVGDSPLLGEALDWYVMVYDTSLLDVENWDLSDYASGEDARQAVWVSRLWGSSGLIISASVGNDDYVYLESNLDGSDWSFRTIGTIVFNTDDPLNAPLDGLMFANATRTEALPNMQDPSQIALVDYEIGTLGYVGSAETGFSQWQAIPEPSSILVGLAGIFALRAALQKKRKNAS